MGKGKYHMEVGGIDYLSPAFIHPKFFLDGLTVGAVPVFTGTAVDFGMSTVLTPVYTVSEISCFAVHDRMSSFCLNTGRLERSSELLPSMRKNLLDIGLSHLQALPSCQKDSLHGTFHFQQDGRIWWWNSKTDVPVML